MISSLTYINSSYNRMATVKLRRLELSQFPKPVAHMTGGGDGSGGSDGCGGSSDGGGGSSDGGGKVVIK